MSEFESFFFHNNKIAIVYWQLRRENSCLLLLKWTKAKFSRGKVKRPKFMGNSCFIMNIIELAHGFLMQNFKLSVKDTVCMKHYF